MSSCADDNASDSSSIALAYLVNGCDSMYSWTCQSGGGTPHNNAPCGPSWGRWCCIDMTLQHLLHAHPKQSV